MDVIENNPKVVPDMQRSVSMSTSMGKKVRQMVKDNNRLVHEASQNGEPIAYVFPAGCYDEILVAMDIRHVAVENFAGLCGVKRVADGFIDASVAEGYSRDICTYTSTILGFDILRSRMGELPDAPDGGLPKPTVMLGQGSSLCAPRTKIFQAVQRYMDVPMFVNNCSVIPPADANIDEVRPYYVKYLVGELRNLIKFLEKNTGRKLDYDKLSVAADYYQQTRKLTSEIQELRKTVPTPMPSADVMGVLVPVMFMIGRPETVAFYQQLKDELQERVATKATVIADEKFRLLYGPGLPPWYALWLFNYVQTMGAVFVTEFQYPIWDYVPIPDTIHDPLERIAYRYFEEKVTYHRQAQKNTKNPDVEKLLTLVNDFKVDGIVANRAYSCRGIHAGIMHKLQALKEFSDVPSVTLELDMVDMKTYSEDQVKKRLADFMGLVAARVKT